MKRQILVVAVVISLLVPVVAHARRGREPQIPPTTPRQFISAIDMPRVGAVEVTIIATEADKERAEADLSATLSNALSMANTIMSDIDAINAAPRKTTLEVSDKPPLILERCKEFAAQTKGDFDITANGKWKKIKVKSKSKTVTLKHEDMEIDTNTFSLILRGFIVDDMMQELKGKGWNNVQVELANVVRTAGRNIHTPWTVRIGAESEEGKHAFRAFDYSVGNVATAKMSTPYYPLQTDDPAVIKTIVFAQDAFTATAYAVAAFAKGTKKAEDGIKFIQMHPEVKGIVIAKDGKMYTSMELPAKSKSQ